MAVRLCSQLINFHGTINDAYEIGCEMERKRVECSIMIKAALADNEKEVY
ncbi:hypothetical protein OBE_17212 [human gut metagenome]|uniref:Uncharacterized protein n=1 Tax=human gut metagenome TaxID=408170 RepID=K1RHG7_9ZZZZ